MPKKNRNGGFFSRIFTREEWAVFLLASMRQDKRQRRFAIAVDRRNRSSFRASKGCLGPAGNPQAVLVD
jgi:hypothetical protein